MKIARALASLGVVFALLLSAPRAEAQNEGFAVNRFEPSERGSHWFALESLDFRGKVRPAIGIVGDYQHRPLAIYDRNGDLRTPVVNHMLTAHVGGSLVLAETLRFAVSMPFIPYVEGQSGRLNGVTYNAPASENTVGDLRFAFDVKLFGEGEDAISAAIGAQAWIPTGDQASYASDGTFRGAPRLLIAGSPGIFTYAVKAGVMIRGDDARDFANSPVGHDFIYGAAAGVRVADRRLVIGPELFGSTVLTEQTFKTRTSPFELLFGARYMSASGIRFGAGAGPGLNRGYGAPALRVVGVVEWSPEVDEDRDGDGIPDSEDACPDTKGVRSADPDKNGCPAAVAPPKPADRDGDGILDDEDACPDNAGVRTDDKRTNGCADKDGDGIYDPLDACVDEPGIASDDPKLNGCPDPDRDKDGVPNAEDACPDVAGVKTTDPKTNGCPDPDRDNDGIPNDADACPDEPGKPDPDPKKNGCPKAFVAQGQIKILDQVKFRTNSAQILPGKDSEEVLQAVLKVLKDHPEITKLRIEGHTDNTGTAKTNTKLSGDRAASVVTWLVNNGIAKDRLTSKGFGQDNPIDTNTTEEGRRNNRRVEFHIESSPTPSETPKP
jgi:OmpA-OmpF porin, OOP family